MFRPLIANDHMGHPPPTSPTRTVSKTKKASTACLACKQRKTKCSGGQPCEQCGQRSSHCVYDLAADQRRKIANQRNIQELAQKVDDIDRFCVLLGGILATIRAGDHQTVDDLLRTVRARSGLPDLASYVDNLMTANATIYEEFQQVDFYLDDAPRQPAADEGTQASPRAERFARGEGFDTRSAGTGADLAQARPDGEGSAKRGKMVDGNMGGGDRLRRRSMVDGENIDGHGQDHHAGRGQDRIMENVETTASDRTMVDGQTRSQQERVRRHESLGSVSDNGSSVMSGRAPRPWELP